MDGENVCCCCLFPSGNRNKEEMSNISDFSAENQWPTAYEYIPDLVVSVAMKNLLVASEDVAQDLSTLKTYKVTHILNVGHRVANVFPKGFQYLKVELLDSPDQDLLSHYPAFEKFIDQGRAQGKVLVHCNAGRSQSASVAVAYLMSKERLSVDQALARLRMTRQAVEPNEGFMAQLRTLQKKLGIQNQ